MDYPTKESVEKAIQPYVESSLPEVIVIQDGDQLIEAGAALRELKTRKNEIETLRKSITRPLDEAKKNLLALFDPVVDRFNARESALKRAIYDYNQRIETERRLLEARLRDEQAAEQEAAEQVARELRRSFRYEQAEAVLDAVPSVPVVIADRPKLEGISERSTWKAEVVDKIAFLIYIIDHDAWNYVEFNQTALNAAARASKGALQIPGVRFYDERTIVARGS